MKTNIKFLKPPLNNFIDYFYYFEGYEPFHTKDRFLPDGEVQIIFDLTDNPKYIYDNESLIEIQKCQKVWFSGFRTKPITIPSGQKSKLLIVQFKKGKALPFLNTPMNYLTNNVVDAELVLDKEILNIRDKLIESSKSNDIFEILENQLIKIYKNKLYDNKFIDYSISLITSSPNYIRINSLSNKIGYSQKHLIKIFKENVGVTPKEFLKVIRFQMVINKLENEKFIDWIDIAFNCGYYDQSHFIHDFKKFSGFTPTEYLLKKNTMINYIPID